MQLFREMTQKPYLWAATLTVVAVFALHGGASPVDVGGGFFNGHVWVVSHVSEMLSGSVPLHSFTDKMGAPDGADLRLIAWAPVLIAAPLSWVVGAPVATWVVTILGLWVSWVVVAMLIRRVVDVSTTVALAAASTYVFGAFGLGLLANGQLAKLQLWCLPLLLLCVDKLIRDVAVLRPALMVLLSSIVMAFTSPSIALVMPPAVGVWVLLRSRWTPRGVWIAGIALIAAAVGLVPAYIYHSLPATGVAGFVPASPVPGLEPPSNLNPVTTWSNLLGMGVRWDRSVSAINHVSAVGGAALLAGVLALVRRPRVAASGLALCVVGVVLALGPEVEASGTTWLFPAALLERFGYPLTESGMYYRFVQVAALGLSICMATLVLWRPMIGYGFMAASLASGVYVTADLWPRVTRPVPNADLLQALADDPREGSVLEFPMAHLDTEGDHRLLAQLVHGRPTSVLPQNIVVRGAPRLEHLTRLSQTEDATTALQTAGFRYVLLHNPRREKRLLAMLSQRFGEPKGNGALAIWLLP